MELDFVDRVDLRRRAGKPARAVAFFAVAFEREVGRAVLVFDVPARHKDLSERGRVEIIAGDALNRHTSFDTADRVALCVVEACQRPGLPLEWRV